MIVTHILSTCFFSCFFLLFDDDELNKQILEMIKFSFSFKGLFDFKANINWFYSYQLSTQAPIHSNVIFDNKSETFFLASESKV